MKIVSIMSTAADLAALQIQNAFNLIVNPDLVAEATGAQSKKVKNFFGILLIIVIAVFLLFARRGAIFMFGTLGMIIAIAFAVISIIGIVAYLRGWLPKSLKWIVLIFEICNLGFDAYVAGGQWGRASVDTQIITEINERQNESEQFAGKVNGFFELNNSLAKTATTVEKIEESRDGKGTVYEAATKMAGEFTEQSSLNIAYREVTKDSLAVLSSVEEILAYLVNSQRGMMDQEQKGLEPALAIQEKAKSFVIYLNEMQEKMTDGYSQERLANLARLKSAVQSVANYTLPQVPEMVSWTKSDIYKAIGWGDRLFIPLLALIISGLLIVVLWTWGDRGADRTRFDREVILLVANFKLQRSGLRHALPTDWFPTISEQQLLDLTDDAEILKAIKRSGMTYERLLATYTILGQENFVAIMDGSSKWNLVEAVRLTEDPKATPYLHDIIARLTFSKWDVIAKFCDRPGDILRLTDHGVQNVLLLVALLRTKLYGDDAKVNSAVDRLFVADADDRYFAVLLRLIDAATNAAQINAITDRLAKVVTPDTVEYVATILRSITLTDERFVDIAKNWQQIDTKTVAALQTNRIAGQIQAMVNKTVKGGYSLLRSLFEAYEQAVQGTTTSLASQNVGVDTNALATAMAINDVELLRAAFHSIFTVS